MPTSKLTRKRVQGPVRLTPAMIPNTPDFDVEGSSFFKTRDKLPSPEEVRAQAYSQHISRRNLDKRKKFSVTGPYVSPPPVLFEEMNLVVKWGTSARISEAQTLYAINHVLNDGVPVPELFGWRTQEDAIFIYMQYIPGQTLESAWDTMEQYDRLAICKELRIICDNVRCLEQDPLDNFIGSINRDALYDRAFDISYMSEAGPFTAVRDFHNWFTFLPRRRMSDPYCVPIEPFRYELPDDSVIKFTHGDLHPSNIIITSSRPYHVAAIVDWEQSGWLPAYWEVRKAQLTADRSQPWSTTYLPIILDQYTSTWDPWDYYIMSMGC